MKHNQEIAEQLLDSTGERPQEHILKSPKKPTAQEKKKAAKQREAIRRDTGR